MILSLKKITYLLLLFLSVVITIFGIFKNQSIFTTSWVHESSHRNLVVFTLGFMAFSLLGSIALRRRVLSIILATIAIFSLFVLGFSNFFVPIIVFYGSCHLGYLVLDLLNLRNTRASLEVSLLIGLSFFCLATYLLSLAPYNTVQTYSILLLLPFLINSKNISRVFYELKGGLNKLSYFSFKEAAVTLAILWGLLIHFHQAIRPEFDFDALAAHLMVPHFIKANGYWSFNFNQFVFGANQLGADMLYAFSYVLSGEEGTRFFNFLMFSLLIKLSYEISRIFASRLASLVLTLSLVLTPLLFTQTTSLHIEGVWVSFVLGVNILCLQIVLSKQIIATDFFRALIVLSIISGTALAIKLPTLFYLPFIFLALFVAARQNGFKFREIGRGLFFPAILFVVFGLSPYIYCYSLTGNPVFPYFNGVFKSEYFYRNLSFNNPLFNVPLSLRTVYDMTFHGSWYLESLDYPISLTYLIFLAPILYFIVNNLKDVGILLIASQVFISAIGIYVFQSYFRYLLPSLVLFVTLCAALLEYFRLNQKTSYRVSMSAIFLSLPISIIHIPDPTHNYKEFNWVKAVSRNVEEDRILRRPQQVVFDFLNSQYGNKATVFHVHSPLTAGLDALSLVPVWYNPELVRRVELFKSKDDVKNLVSNYGISHFITNSNDIRNIFIKEFLEKHANIEMKHSNVTLFKVDFRTLPENNLIRLEDINANVVSIDLDGAQNLLLIQNFDFIPDESADFVTVLNWLNAKGESVDWRSISERVSHKKSFFDYYLAVPTNATTLVISLPKIDPKDQEAYKIQLVRIGDQSMIDHYRGE